MVVLDRFYYKFPTMVTKCSLFYFCVLLCGGGGFCFCFCWWQCLSYLGCRMSDRKKQQQSIARVEICKLQYEEQKSSFNLNADEESYFPQEDHQYCCPNYQFALRLSIPRYGCLICGCLFYVCACVETRIMLWISLTQNPNGLAFCSLCVASCMRIWVEILFM